MWESPKQFHNPKSEAADPKQSQNPKFKCSKGDRAMVSDSGFGSLEFVSDFEFRI